MKKNVLMSLVLLAMAGASMVFAQANNKEPPPMLKFTEIHNGYQVSGNGANTKGAITIPGIYNGKPVIAIAVDGFNNSSAWAYAGLSYNGITSVTIPDSVKEIGMGAFQNCKGIVSVSMGKNVTKIGANAFKDCGSLTEFNGANIGENVVTIGSCAFQNCGKLKKVWIRSSVKTIEDGAFSNCGALTRVTFNQAGVKILDANAFPGNLKAAYDEGGKGSYNSVMKGGRINSWEKVE